MKRSSVAARILGVLVSAAVIALHATGVLAPVERAVASIVPGAETTPKIVSAVAHYLLVLIVALGVAYLVLTSNRRKRLGLPVGIIAIELLALTAICLLYQTFFQPLPSLLALGLGFVAANGYATFMGRNRSRLARDLFAGRLAQNQIDDILAGDLAFEAEAKSHEVTAVVCDIANKHDLAEECSPAVLAEVTQKFIRHASESFLKAGAYIENVTGEGIVAVFGFPRPDEDQAEKATKHALALLDSFEQLRGGKDSAADSFSVHLGISSGTMIVAPLEGEDDRAHLLATGEPVELARRFCIANRFYGSRVLIGPRTFELASKAIVARPIDFLSGVDVRERHEIYEPLMLAAEATPEQIARRDSFWNGVVLYREKRWAEAYTQFQAARGPNGQDDAPLQLYVRRLEPLALQLVESPDE
jgi:adenylate cyclase